MIFEGTKNKFFFGLGLTRAGKTLPDIASLISLSELYNISLDELIKGDFKMTEKLKKDAKELRVKRKIIITVAVIAVIFGILYVICGVIGGAPEDFSKDAAPWVFFGIALSGALTYLNAMETGKED